MDAEMTIGGSSYLLRDVHDTLARLSDAHRTQVNVVLGAFRSFRGDRRAHIGYVTVPVTTGKRYYEVLSKEGVFTREALAEKCGPSYLYENVIVPNVVDSIQFVDKLGLTENRLFIAPSVFDAKALQWSDDAYMALWYRVIGEMAGKHNVMDGWGYSYGGVREVIFSLMLQFRIVRMSNLAKAVDEFGIQNFLPGMNHEEKCTELEKMWTIRIYDSEQQEIRLPTALKECVRVITELHERGFPVENLLSAAVKMMQLPFFAPSFYEPYPLEDEYFDARNDLDVLRKKIVVGKTH